MELNFCRLIYLYLSKIFQHFSILSVQQSLAGSLLWPFFFYFTLWPLWFFFWFQSTSLPLALLYLIITITESFIRPKMGKFLVWGLQPTQAATREAPLGICGSSGKQTQDSLLQCISVCFLSVDVMVRNSTWQTDHQQTFVIWPESIYWSPRGSCASPQRSPWCRWTESRAAASSSSAPNWCSPKCWRPSCGCTCGLCSRPPPSTCRSSDWSLSRSRAAATSASAPWKSSSTPASATGKVLTLSTCCRTGSSSRTPTGELTSTPLTRAAMIWQLPRCGLGRRGW